MKHEIKDIIQQINMDFTKTYKNASNFPGTTLYNNCLKIIGDVSNLKCIIFANDLGIPPVKSLLVLLSKYEMIYEDVTPLESQCMGSLMGFVFKNILGYKNQKERLSVKMFGVKTATNFYEVENFTIE